MSSPDVSAVHVPDSDSERDLSYVYGASISVSGYSRSSSITPSAREKVTNMAPGGCRCVITLRQSNLECAHILRRTTSQHHRRALAYCWGIKCEELNIDAADNMMWLTPDMHRSFNKNQWILLPHATFLLTLQSKALMAGPGRQAFTKSNPPQRGWEYTFVQLVPCPDTLTREGSVPPTIHFSPYELLPTIISHIHPYYAICNVGQKDATHHADKTKSGQYNTLPPGSDICPRIQACRVIYENWLQTKPNSPAYLGAPSQSTRSLRSAHLGSSSKKDHLRTKQRIRRAKLVDGSKSALVTQREDKAERDNKAQDSCTTSTASTSEELQSVTDEEHTYNSYHSQAVVPFQSKVGQWLADQHNSIELN